MSTFRMLIGPDEGADVQQLAVRAVLLLAFGIVCIRVTGRRTFAQYTPLDIIVALIVGSNISRVMTGKAAVWPALAATFTLVMLHRLLAYATLRWSFLTPLVKAKPVILVEDGELNEHQMRRAEMGRDDLMEALRMEQVEQPSRVRLAVLEAGGKVSVIKREG